MANKCVTKTRATALGCEVSGSYSNNQLVQVSDLRKAGYSIRIKVTETITGTAKNWNINVKATALDSLAAQGYPANGSANYSEIDLIFRTEYETQNGELDYGEETYASDPATISAGEVLINVDYSSYYDGSPIVNTEIRSILHDFPSFDVIKV